MPTILLMEDDHDQAQLLGQILFEAGYEVISCGTGNDALARIEKGGIDLLLTDIFVSSGGRLRPDGGILLIGRLRAARSLPVNRRWALIPIIAITGMGRPETRAHILASAHAVGADAVFTKPVDTGELTGTIARLLAEAPLREDWT